jgi:phage terminase small subunit
MAAKGELTPKKQLFVAEYTVDWNATQAAIRAGYSKKTAYSIGNELLNKPEIQAAIKAHLDGRAKKCEVTAESLIAELEEARLIALGAETPQSSAAVAATMGKAKLVGLDKVVIDHKSSDGSMSPNIIEIVAGGE